MTTPTRNRDRVASAPGHKQWLKLKTPAQLANHPSFWKTEPINATNTRYPHLVVSYPTMTEVREQYFADLQRWLREEWPHLRDDAEARAYVHRLQQHQPKKPERKP